MSRDDIVAAYRRKELSLDDACRRIRDLEDPPPQWVWLLVAGSILVVGAVTIAAVRT